MTPFCQDLCYGPTEPLVKENSVDMIGTESVRVRYEIAHPQLVRLVFTAPFNLNHKTNTLARELSCIRARSQIR